MKTLSFGNPKRITVTWFDDGVIAVTDSLSHTYIQEFEGGEAYCFLDTTDGDLVRVEGNEVTVHYLLRSDFFGSKEQSGTGEKSGTKEEGHRE